MSEPPEELWHYLRRCEACGTEWGSLHCPHEGVQGRCPACGLRPTVIPEPPEGCACDYDV